MRILAADIGGTNSRFSQVEIDSLAAISMTEPLIFPTWSEHIESFDQLLNHYSEHRPAGSPDVEDFDALSIAIAGAVAGQRATVALLDVARRTQRTATCDRVLICLGHQPRSRDLGLENVAVETDEAGTQYVLAARVEAG